MSPISVDVRANVLQALSQGSAMASHDLRLARRFAATPLSLKPVRKHRCRAVSLQCQCGEVQVDLQIGIAGCAQQWQR